MGSPFASAILNGPATEPLPAPEIWKLPSQGITVFHGELNLPRISHYFLPRILLAGNPVLYLDGANRFDPLLLARFARSRGKDASTFNKRIRIARAFTCFQLTELITRLPVFLREFPARAVFITGLPDLYFDEDVQEPEAKASFQHALNALKQLAQRRLALAVFTKATGVRTTRQKFFRQLKEQANQVRWFVDEAEGGPSFVIEKNGLQLK